ncbi:protein retinal degeneration B isoform X5 [Linepithema humile]|uniref:protein retinal degeneration B isoform X5 n=1 Tax=Linepithema humile TaxID=83485 RepID=UPI000623545E|nr:PREDICTED: protein retinal degeneration B isoform X5 [Linepithema humile]
MLIKEYRIPLPLTVEEYRIAQLYMIAKKSREESKGAGSGVEILENEPYTDGPGGSGQYTHKLYHVGSHLPGWLKSLLPKSALITKEEAWNAYPYTKTRFTCPFVEKFYVEIETYYFPDDGHQENVFNLSGSDYRNRIVDVIDIVKDQPYGADYLKEEDPKLYVSEKSGRGPLEDTWLEDYWADVEGKQQPTPSGKSLMCAYKLCRVEFRYWGMQTKLEKFIHDVALRKVMVRAHRQAWAWQDEWIGLTMEDIREIERQTQLALQRKMGLSDSTDEELDGEGQETGATASAATNAASQKSEAAKTLAVTLGSIEKNEDAQSPPSLRKPSDIPIINTAASSEGEISPEDSPVDLNEIKTAIADDKASAKKEWRKNVSLHSPNSNKSFDIQIANWRMESIVRESESGSDDEFFDCQAGFIIPVIRKEGEDMTVQTPSAANEQEDTIFSPSYLKRVVSERSSKRLQITTSASIDVSCPTSPQHSPTHQPCKITVLIIVVHGGSVLDANVDLTAKKSDITTFRGAFESVMRQHYPSMVGHVSVKFVACPSVCTEGLGILSSLSPYSFDVSPSCMDAPQVTHDTIPIGAIPLLVSSSSDYQDAVSRVVMNANQVYHEFIKSDEGKGFIGQICFVGDSVGSILTYDALCRATQHSRHSSENSILEGSGQQSNDNGGNEDGKHLSAPSPRRRSSGTSDNPHHTKLDFEVGDFFTFGSPLSLVLAYRKIAASADRNSFIPRPLVNQMYNLFHPTDPVAARLEPLISARFSLIPPVNIARYQKYPLGNGQPYHLLETIQTNPQLFADGLNVPNIQLSHLRRLSDISLQSTMSGIIDNVPLQAVSALTQKWWGTKRLDYALYCPEGLANFPTNALPHLFHASYWESSDVIAFILRQLGRFDLPLLGNDEKDLSFRPGQPREKWNKKRTSVKLKNVAANHRANDVIVREGAPQILIARFMYSPIDMITLTGEKVDIHIMKDAPAGEWTYISTEVTDKNGRVIYKIPDDKALGYGLYPVKMVVRGDHTSVDFFVAVIPPRTECVVFSIDGSFAASRSVSGKDPKVWAGAVDVVRHWQELGYLIIYITARPDMQQQTVVSWLSQHNFPHGLVSFADGLSRDPLAHKAAYLNKLVKEHGMLIHQAYGSEKDISVYTAINLKPSQIFIIGKVSKKHQVLATILYDGYAAHLSMLQAHGGSRPAQGNARMVIPRGQFGLPGQNPSLRRRSSFRMTKRAISQPPLGKAPFPLERSTSVGPPASTASTNVQQSASTEKL